MADLKSTGDILKESIYNWLWKDFFQFSLSLTEQQRTDLDGKLWKLATTLADAGMWNSLQDTVGLSEIGTAARP
jgi:hypothetical protein